jgi:hypothetical protein
LPDKKDKLLYFTNPATTASLLRFLPYTISKSKMISRRQEGGNEAYFTYVEEADDDANKDSALI